MEHKKSREPRGISKYHVIDAEFHEPDLYRARTASLHVNRPVEPTCAVLDAKISGTQKEV